MRLSRDVKRELGFSVHVVDNELEDAEGDCVIDTRSDHLRVEPFDKDSRPELTVEIPSHL